MTDKRFEEVMNEFDEVEYIMDKVAMEDMDFAEFIDFVEDICNENEQLKQQLKIYKEDGLETLNDLQRAEENNRKALNNIEKLIKENKELKKQLDCFKPLIFETDGKPITLYEKKG